MERLSAKADEEQGRVEVATTRAQAKAAEAVGKLEAALCQAKVAGHIMTNLSLHFFITDSSHSSYLDTFAHPFLLSALNCCLGCLSQPYVLFCFYSSLLLLSLFDSRSESPILSPMLSRETRSFRECNGCWTGRDCRLRLLLLLATIRRPCPLKATEAEAVNFSSRSWQPRVLVWFISSTSVGGLQAQAFFACISRVVLP